MSDCNTIQIIEGGTDPNLDEKGEVALAVGQSEVSVTFTRSKAGTYRFEYLYVDAFGQVNPGTIEPVVTAQTQYGFTVKLGGVAEATGYVLRWHVVVISVTTSFNVDAPESFRVQIPNVADLAPPPAARVLTVTFQNPRSNTLYGFSELRVENLIDNPATQTPIAVQVCAKTQTNFTICFSPAAPTNNYFLVGRTP